MDEDWRTGFHEDDTDNLPPVSGYRYGHFWVDGAHISVDDCPACLKGGGADCSQCEFFMPETCRLLRDPFLRKDIQTFFDIERERRLRAQKDHKRRLNRLIRAMHSELQAHGRPLHYTVLARIVADRYPKLRVSESRVLKILNACPKLFGKVTEGVYQHR